jgi:hypothetical protein
MFTKGMTKPAGSGRKKGSGNHAQNFKREDAHQTFASLGFNPIVESVKLFRAHKTTLDLKIKLVSELLKYFAPKLSTSAVAHTLSGSIEVEAIQSLMLNADPATAKALETLSLELSRLQLDAHRAAHVDPDAPRDRQILDVRALPSPEEPTAEPGAARDD